MSQGGRRSKKQLSFIYLYFFFPKCKLSFKKSTTQVMPGDKALVVAVLEAWFLNGTQVVHMHFQSLGFCFVLLTSPARACVCLRAVSPRPCFVLFCCIREVATVHLILSLPPCGTSLCFYSCSQDQGQHRAERSILVAGK